MTEREREREVKKGGGIGGSQNLGEVEHVKRERKSIILRARLLSSILMYWILQTKPEN